MAYIYHAGVHAGVVGKSLTDNGYSIRAQCVWKKQHFAISRGAFHHITEPVFYAVRQGESACWVGGRSETTFWEFQNLNPFGGAKEERTEHSTQKPIRCFEHPISLHDDKNDGLVIDPFAGSGTAVIACERQLRRCAMVELEPKWVDTILERYANYSGIDPIREDGKKWSELKSENGLRIMNNQINTMLSNLLPFQQQPIIDLLATIQKMESLNPKRIGLIGCTIDRFPAAEAANLFRGNLSMQRAFKRMLSYQGVSDADFIDLRSMLEILIKKEVERLVDEKTEATFFDLLSEEEEHTQ